MPTFLVIKGNWNNVILNVVGGGKANVDKVFAHAANNKWFEKIELKIIEFMIK